MQPLPSLRTNTVRRVLLPVAILALLGLSGCVVYPAHPGYAYGDGSYYAPGYYYGPPAVVDFGWWGGGHWDGGHEGGGRWGGGHWGGGWHR